MQVDYQKVCIKPESTILQALEVINNESLRVALVVGAENHLVGIVADGDIRRGILEGHSLEDAVQTVMNIKPITAPVDAIKSSLLRIMNEFDLQSIPILDGKRLVGLETLHNALAEPDVIQNPVFIMAGGFGKRLMPLTDNCPKPMLKVGDTPILETIIASFRCAGFVNFYISVHYLPEIVQTYFGDGSDYGVNITYIHEQSPLGTGGALGLLPDDLPGGLPLIMINGDILTRVNLRRLLDFHMRNNCQATMGVREYDYQIPYGVISGKGNMITNMVEKPIKTVFVNAGVYVLSNKLVKSVARNVHIDMPTLLQNTIDNGDDVRMFPIHEYWLDIGSIGDFNRAQIDIETLRD